MKNIEIKSIANKEESISNFMLEKGFSSNNIFHQINQKNVLINGDVVRDKNVTIKSGQEVTIILNSEVNELPLNTTPIEILYEDEYLLLVNKPSDLHVEPYKKDTNNNLASMIANYFFEKKIPSKVHLVNRLDKCTSGIVIIAKNRYIKNLMCNVDITKKYQAIVEGNVEDSNTIKINIGKEANSNSRILNASGKEAITKYEKISYDKNNDSSLVEVEILTGRTHQIRLSFSSIGHPLVGDKLYGSKVEGPILLKAFYTKFRHPIINKDIEIRV